MHIDFLLIAGFFSTPPPLSLCAVSRNARFAVESSGATSYSTQHYTAILSADASSLEYHACILDDRGLDFLRVSSWWWMGALNASARVTFHSCSFSSWLRISEVPGNIIDIRCENNDNLSQTIIDTQLVADKCCALRGLKLVFCATDKPGDWRHLAGLHSSLTALHLEMCNMRDIQWISALISLKDLSLTYAFVQDWMPLSQLPDLKTLNIEGYVLGNIEWIPNCRGLETLNLSRASSIGSWAPLTRLQHLYNLLLCGATIDTIDWLPQCTSLEAIDLSECTSVRHWSPLGECQGLLSLTMRACPLLSIEWISKLSELRSLDVSRCDTIRSWHEALRCLQRLVRLDVSWTNMSDLTCLAQCKSLQWVNMSSCESLRGWDVLSQLTHLQFIDLSWTNVSSMDWVRACFSLRELRLSNCNGIVDWTSLEGLPLHIER